jgi:hypothetical protein
MKEINIYINKIENRKLKKKKQKNQKLPSSNAMKFQS